MANTLIYLVFNEKGLNNIYSNFSGEYAITRRGGIVQAHNQEYSKSRANATVKKTEQGYRATLSLSGEIFDFEESNQGFLATNQSNLLRLLSQEEKLLDEKISKLKQEKLILSKRQEEQDLVTDGNLKTSKQGDRLEELTSAFIFNS